MIKEVKIKNFKSVVDLTLELGTFNVLIGENGCGKSNILEAIGFGAAASADKLDFEFLGSRGIRVTNPELMYAAFLGIEPSNKIELSFEFGKNTEEKVDFVLTNGSNGLEGNWRDTQSGKLAKDIFRKESELNNDEGLRVEKKRLESLLELSTTLGFDSRLGSSIEELLEKALKLDNISKDELKEMLKSIRFSILTRHRSNPHLSNFVIYSPEHSKLRKFEETNQIYPLGIKGEGLFQYLKALSKDSENAVKLEEIQENMQVLDWYENFNIPKGLLSNEYSLTIKDKYLSDTVKHFDQRSTNEGFLYLLFYFTLFASSDTPAFFAIDNIDTALNPKLCRMMIQNLAVLAKKHGKQVILTTHNPAVLDGLDLQDENQRLFVVRRNDEGHTKAKRIQYNPKREMKLSELWTNGYIGGLPDNF